MDWTEAQKYTTQNRQQIVKKLSEYSLNDAILFLGINEGLRREQEKNWLPLLEWIKQRTGAEFRMTETLDMPEENLSAQAALQKYFDTMPDQSLTACYAAALDMRSVLLAIALTEGRINAQEAFELSELEELYQARIWGMDAEAEARRDLLKKSLEDIKSYLKS